MDCMNRTTKTIALGAALAAATLLSACQTPGSLTGAGFANPQQAITAGPVAEPTGEIIGNGAVRVALLVPISATGNIGRVGQALRQTAILALQDYSTADMTLIIKDTKGNAGDAAIKAQEAIQEGAEIIIGPLRSASTKAVGAIARPAGVPVIAFSNDVGAATNGVYLLSFLQQNDVDRIVSFAVGRGKRSFAALLPKNSTGEGKIYEAAFRQAVARHGGRIVAIETYNRGNRVDPFQLQSAAEKLGEIKTQIDALFIPDGLAASQAAQLLAGQEVLAKNIAFLGSGQWDNERVQKEPLLAGAWYPGPQNQFAGQNGQPYGFTVFSRRYEQQFGAKPPRIASLGYDAVILTAELIRSAGPQRFTAPVLTNSQGVFGIDGLFRFRKDGTNERGLAVYEIGKKAAVRIIDQAPSTFQ